MMPPARYDAGEQSAVISVVRSDPSTTDNT